MLALDLPDRFGVRHLLPAHLMAAGRDAEAEEWLAEGFARHLAKRGRSRSRSKSPGRSKRRR